MSTTPAPVSNRAITALVLGAVGLLIVTALFGVFKFLGLALAIAALVVGGFAGRRGEDGRLYALIGAGLGAVAVVWFVVWAVASSR